MVASHSGISQVDSEFGGDPEIPQSTAQVGAVLPTQSGQLEAEMHGGEAAVQAACQSGADAAQEMEQRLVPLRGETLGDQLISQLIEFVHEQSQAAMPGERLLGSTECLESLIGKGKRLEGQQSRSGFTKMILGMAASVVTPTYQAIQTALAAVKTKDLYAWGTVHLGPSVQAKRRLAFASVAEGTKTG
jgi:microcompartment protein CcmL/EutN